MIKVPILNEVHADILDNRVRTAQNNNIYHNSTILAQSEIVFKMQQAPPKYEDNPSSHHGGMHENNKIGERIAIITQIWHKFYSMCILKPW